MAEQDRSIVIPDSGSMTKPRGLIHAISEIEQFSVAEQEAEIPDEALTTGVALSFFEVGLKTGLLSGLVTTLLTPVMIAASRQLLPVFGSYNMNLFDRLFSLLLTVSLPLGYALFVGLILTRIYSGNITKKTTNNLIGGLCSGAFLKGVISFLFFHFVYIKVTEYKLAEWITWFMNTRFAPDFNYQKIYDWLVEFRAIFIPSAYFVLAVNFTFIMILLISLSVGRIKAKKWKAFMDKWK